jgi:hypothetical protein
MLPEEWPLAAVVAAEVAAEHPLEITSYAPLPASRTEMEDWVVVAPSLPQLEKVTVAGRKTSGQRERIVTAFKHMRAGRCHPGTLKLIQ